MTATSKPRRRWFQCSLRTLLVLMLLACIGMGWIAVKRQRARKERAAVEAIEGLGGSVSWAYPDFPKESQGQDCRWLTALDAAYFVVVAAMILCRWFDQQSRQAITTTGESATWADFRRYALLLPPLAIGAWILANAIGNHVF